MTSVFGNQINLEEKAAGRQEFPNLKCPCSGPLLLEQILEGLPRVVVSRWGSGGGLGFLRVGGGSGVLLDRGAKFVERTIIFCVFGRDALRDRLGALKLRARIEEAALFATMQFKLAFGAFPVGIETGGEDRSAVGTADTGYGADHTRGARAELIRARAPLRGPAIVTIAARLVLLIVLFRVAVPAVTVLSIHKRLRPSVLTDYHQESLSLRRENGSGAKSEQLRQLAVRTGGTRKPQSSADCALRKPLIRVARCRVIRTPTWLCIQSD